MTKYVCGFYFDAQKENVLLIWKQKPKWQEGKLNGIGGKIEPKESPLKAMRREFKEECGIDHLLWINFITIAGEDYKVHFFAAIDSDNKFEYAETKESEEVAKIEVDQLDDYHHIENLRWLIPMAKHKLNNLLEKFSF